MNSEDGSEFTVKMMEDVERGYVAFSADDDDPSIPEALPVMLASAMQQWLEENPDLVVHSTLPITQNGNTIAIHIWYDPATID